MFIMDKVDAIEDIQSIELSTVRMWIDENANVLRKEVVPQYTCRVCGDVVETHIYSRYGEGRMHSGEDSIRCLTISNAGLDMVLGKSKGGGTTNGR